ncbi:MAG: CoB--CoM heterodisulfide reductase iron-sulfur subunit A family protein [Thermoplasmata archaeon]|nr:CoB--CoM heterodisulfide reductase iron-sulfur subunit A family protein [Thermoplasmata archaeon]
MNSNNNSNKKVLVIGGGVAGMQASIDLAKRGYQTYLVERDDQLGGRAYQLSMTFPTHECKPDGCCMHYCRECIYTPKLEELQQNPNLDIMLNTEVTDIKGKQGDYKIELTNGKGKNNLEVNAIIIATGSRTFDPNKLPEYGYQNDDVITFLELEKMIVAQRLEGNDFKRPSDGKIPKKINFLLCVGSRDLNKGNSHCSIVCCTYAIGQAKDLKRRYPDAEIIIHYMDLRAAYRGFEEFYREAQEMGVIFVRGRVAAVEKEGAKLNLKSENLDLGEPSVWKSDLVILAVGQEPHEGTDKIANMLSLNLAENGFIQDSLPMDYTEKSGISVIGCALGPRGIRYSVKEALEAVDAISEFLGNNGAVTGKTSGGGE